MNRSKLYWNNRYVNGGTSGYGSYGEQLARKLKWLSGLPINSISEIGCGDFNFGSNLLKLYPNATYHGYDISEAIIEKNQREHPEHSFTSKPELPISDLLLCVDVLFHILDDTEYEQLLTDIENQWVEYLALTAYERDDPNTSPHVKIRKFDPKRYGEALIREIVEEDGSLYFYLFKKPIDLRKVSCVLITKDKAYPPEILNNISRYPFGQVLILTDSDSPYRKHEMFKKAKFDVIYYQDDDAICPIGDLARLSKPDMINVAMKEGHIKAYQDNRATMGLGWGSIFPKSMLKTLKLYTDKYGEDAVFMRETERIFTHLNYPQNRLSLPIIDLPSATDGTRLWQQPEHHKFRAIAEERCGIIESSSSHITP